MKSLFFLIASGILLFTSCTTVYKCGEPRPENFSANKRVTALVNERDSLCSTLQEVQNRNAALETNLNEKSEALDALKSGYTSLETKYEELQTESSQTTDQLMQQLNAKSDELDQKEEMLLEREERLREMQAVIARQDSITAHLNTVLRDALLRFKNDELSVKIKNGKVYVSMSDKLLFKSGSARVQPKGKEAIDTLASVLQDNPDIDVLIEGHTDNVPIKTAKYQDNWDLSAARATSIVRLLADRHNIDEKRLTAAGRGEFQPRASNETKEGRAQNRRTEIILSPKLDELMDLLGQE